MFGWALFVFFVPCFFLFEHCEMEGSVRKLENRTISAIRSLGYLKMPAFLRIWDVTSGRPYSRVAKAGNNQFSFDLSFSDISSTLVITSKPVRRVGHGKWKTGWNSRPRQQQSC